MSNRWTEGSSRRDFLKLTATAGAASAGLLALPGNAQGAPLNFHTWSAAVDTVKSHLTGFEAKTGIKVNYSNSPWAQYRDTMVTKFVGKAPLDVMWVSDTWLPEWADAGWLAPIDGYPELVSALGLAGAFGVTKLITKLTTATLGGTTALCSSALSSFARARGALL